MQGAKAAFRSSYYARKQSFFFSECSHFLIGHLLKMKHSLIPLQNEDFYAMGTNGRLELVGNRDGG